MDGNIERVIARLFAVTDPLPVAKPELRRFAASLTPPERTGDYAQAAMDLGATICTPRQPKCILCPWHDACRARAQGIAEDLPRKAAKAARPPRFGVVFWAMKSDGSVLLRRRAEKGLLGGMMEFPSTPWRTEQWSPEEAIGLAPVRSVWRLLPGAVRHSFTHFDLELSILVGSVRRSSTKSGIWVRPERFGDHALPTLMRKVAGLACDATSLLETGADRR